MATTLWDKFQSAVRYMLGTDNAAVAAYRVADSTQTPATALGQVTTARRASRPAGTNTGGVGVAGLASGNAIVWVDEWGACGGVTVRLCDGKSFGGGISWAEGEEITFDRDAILTDYALPPIDVEGYDRLAFSIVASPEQVNAVYVFPFTPEA